MLAAILAVVECTGPAFTITEYGWTTTQVLPVHPRPRWDGVEAGCSFNAGDAQRGNPADA